MIYSQYNKMVTGKTWRVNWEIRQKVVLLRKGRSFTRVL